MRRFLLLLPIVLLAHVALAQDEYPALVGPVVYADRVNQPPLFEDFGTGEVWEVDMAAFDNSGLIESWSSTGCLALYRRQNTRPWQFALVDVQGRAYEEIDFLAPLDDPELTLSGLPFWSPDGTRLAFAVFDGSNTTFMAYDIASAATEELYVREDTGWDFNARIVDWPSEDTLIYVTWGGDRFAIDLPTRQIRFQPRITVINVPVLSPFVTQLRSPDSQVIATYFDRDEAFGSLDPRLGYVNAAEEQAIRDDVQPVPGVELYFIDSGETVAFNLDVQYVTVAAWSPDSQRLGMMVFPIPSSRSTTGVYIYDRQTNTATRARGLSAVPIGVTQMAWSADSEWVTAAAEIRGLVAYNPTEDRYIELAPPFQNSFVARTAFTSVASYAPGVCG